MLIPSTIRAGDTVMWRDHATADSLGNAIDSSEWGLTYWLRTNTANEGIDVTGTANGAGWEFEITPATTMRLGAGAWFWQAVASKVGAVFTIGTGRLEVLPSLSFQGAPGAFDGRSQARKDLEAVQSAIRALISGGAVRRYMIGSRQLEKYGLAELLELESRLKAEVAREEAAARIANGLGDPRNLFVRFV